MYFKVIIFLLFSQTLLFAQTIGLASWYGEKFEGRITASGEPFNMYGYTAAHKTLAFGTIMTVTNLSNGKSVNVKINDRGPYNSNRIIDISYQAAKHIGLDILGTTEVRIVPLKAQPVPKMKIPEPRASTSSILETVITKDDLASMMEYALRVTDPKKEVTQPVVTATATPAIKVPAKVAEQVRGVQVQVASFATKRGAESFILKEQGKGYQMAIVTAFSVKFQQLQHKVVVLTDSKKSAMVLVNSKQYNGAYILK